MKRLFVVLGLVILGACNGETATQVASPTPRNPTEALGCDFKVPNAMTKDNQLTQASIDAAVAEAPAAIRTDLRTIYESSKRYQDAIRAAQKAPEARRPDMLKAASERLNTPQYRQAATRLRQYFTAHCSGLRRSPAPSP